MSCVLHKYNNMRRTLEHAAGDIFANIANISQHRQRVRYDTYIWYYIGLIPTYNSPQK